MYEPGASSGITNRERKAHVDFKVRITLEDGSFAPDRMIAIEVPVPAYEQTATAKQIITTVDTTRSDVQKYLQEYTTHYEKLESSSADKIRLANNIAEK
jgi:hypothetical protein